MTRAEELVLRIVAEFEARGYEIIERHATDHYTREDLIYRRDIFNEDKTKVIYIEETYRHNGTKENVTAKIMVYDRSEVVKNRGFGMMYRKYETKIPYEASKRVINNRIDKALEKFIYSDPEPFTMDMLDPYFS